MMDGMRDGMRVLIENGRLVSPSAEIEDAAVAVVDGVIRFAGSRADLPAGLRRKASQQQVLDARGGFIVPGFIDVHVHGGGGCDTMDATPEALLGLARAHAREGTTGILPTTVTAPQQQLVAAARALAAVWDKPSDGAAFLGMHLEGPYLNPERKGAQNPDFMRDPSIAELQELLEALGGPGRLKLMTLAPERQGSQEAIAWLVEHGVAVSLGHSAATWEQALAAVGAGARQLTHLFNGMPGLHHREPGLVALGLTDPRVVVQLIADGVHVHPAVMEAVLRARGPSGIALITDALAPMGLGKGPFKLGEYMVEVRGGAARLEGSETLAGSILGMAGALRTMVNSTRATVREAVEMASLTPAKSIGLGHRKGELLAGYDGDVVVLDRQLQVQATVVAGRPVYVREDPEDSRS